MTAEQKALELYPVKYMDEKRGERKHPDLNKPLREAFMRGVEYTLRECVGGAFKKIL